MSRQNYENKRHRTSKPSGRRNPQNRRRRENSYRNSDRNSDWNSDWDSDWDSNWDSGEDYWLFSEDHPDLDDRRSRNSRSRSSRSFDERDTQPQRRRRPSQSNGQRHLDRQRDSGKKWKNKKRKKWKKILLIILLIFALLIAGIFFFILSKAKLLQYHALDEGQLETAKDTGCINIALFGLDSREGELDGGVRSDCMIIASINPKTRQTKLVSVYRDTLLMQQDGTYAKANSAYSYGGPQEAIALLNRNLDLDITKYITVNFNALVSIIDTLGGVEIDVQEEEIPYINAYTVENIKVTGVDSAPVTVAGPQILNGVQATAYARIRYTAGDDFKRTERQRLVLQKIVEKAKSTDPFTLNKLMNQAFPQISTNLTSKDLFGLGFRALWCKLSANTGFPFDVTTSENIKGLTGSFVVPIGLADNVKQLHQYLFNDTDYQPSEKVQQISEDICWLSGVYPNN